MKTIMKNIVLCILLATLCVPCFAQGQRITKTEAIEIAKGCIADVIHNDFWTVDDFTYSASFWNEFPEKLANVWVVDIADVKTERYLASDEPWLQYQLVLSSDGTVLQNRITQESIDEMEAQLIPAIEFAELIEKYEQEYGCCYSLWTYEQKADFSATYHYENRPWGSWSSHYLFPQEDDVSHEEALEIAYETISQYCDITKEELLQLRRDEYFSNLNGRRHWSFAFFYSIDEIPDEEYHYHFNIGISSPDKEVLSFNMLNTAGEMIYQYLNYD